MLQAQKRIRPLSTSFCATYFEACGGLLQVFACGSSTYMYCGLDHLQMSSGQM